MSDVQIIAEALADVMPPLEPSEYWAEAVVAALVDAGRVIVDRNDLLILATCPDCGMPLDENCRDCNVPPEAIEAAERLLEKANEVEEKGNA